MAGAAWAEVLLQTKHCLDAIQQPASMPELAVKVLLIQADAALQLRQHEVAIEVRCEPSGGKRAMRRCCSFRLLVKACHQLYMPAFDQLWSLVEFPLPHSAHSCLVLPSWSLAGTASRLKLGMNQTALGHCS